ncbi:hypothetical protein EDB84DRAFT_696884 [Lactarius hengduanensis]|nr:hypothetical protein EDB84DRAFT_696884 [Lactarius hengduanensis]
MGLFRRSRTTMAAAAATVTTRASPERVRNNGPAALFEATSAHATSRRRTAQRSSSQNTRRCGCSSTRRTPSRASQRTPRTSCATSSLHSRLALRSFGLAALRRGLRRRPWRPRAYRRPRTQTRAPARCMRCHTDGTCRRANTTVRVRLDTHAAQ